MKDYLVALLHTTSTLARGRNLAREYLQARILGVLQRAGAMVPLAFHGGTALRFLYGAARFSEDLGFALEREREQYDFRTYVRRIVSELGAEGYDVEATVSDSKAVHSAWLRFGGLYHELKLSPHRSETLAVKIEVDSDPPLGAGLTTSVVRRHVILNLQHHDPASLLAEKLHAVLQRPYLKGRDLYDLLWYLSDPDWPPPNLKLLNSALRQTNWSGPTLTEFTWREAVRARLMDANWSQAAADVRPFLEAHDASILTRENLLRLLGDD